MNFSRQIFDFYQSLRPPERLPTGIEILFPQADKKVMNLVELFLDKYYSDNHPRTLILGINPGRFGAGITGINFTAPKQLTEICAIPNSLKQQSELSAEFIYEMIGKYGGCEQFYRDFFLSSVSPLGYTKNGININYYDDKQLQLAVTPFIEKCISTHVHWNINRHSCVCIGGEKNYKFLLSLNEEHGWFNKIIPLPHPRFIMQYRRKEKEHYIVQYVEVLHQARIQQ